MRRRQGLRAQMRAWHHASREIAAEAKAAREGVPGGWRMMGRVWRTRVFASDAAANDYMRRNPGWAVIGVLGTRVHLARKDDMGRLEQTLSIEERKGG